MEKELSEIKEQIIAALRHEESTDGLYFSNLFHLHEEDERTQVEGSEEVIMRALEELILEGRVRVQDDGSEMIFFLGE